MFQSIVLPYIGQPMNDLQLPHFPAEDRLKEISRVLDGLLCLAVARSVIAY